MALELSRQPKNFAEKGDLTGVPLSVMSELLGNERVISVGLGNVPGPGSSTRITGGGVSRSEHDLLILSARHTSGSDSILDRTWNVSVDDFWSTTRADEGDTLSTSSQTGILVNSTDGSDSMVIGRSDGGRMLVQLGSWSNPGSTSTYMRLEAILHDGGVLGRRLENVTSSTSRVVTLQRRSATLPPAPTDTEVTYDGVALAIEQNSEWASLELTPTGPDPLWYASTSFRQNASGWDHDEWAVYATGTTFSPEYSTNEGVTWGSTYPSTTPFLYRFRDADGVLHGPYSEGTVGGGFETILKRDVTGSSPSVFVMSPAIDWGGSDIMAITWRNNIMDGTGTERAGSNRTVMIPSRLVKTSTLMALGEQDNQILLRLSDHDGSGFSIGRGLITPSLSDWLGAATQQDQRLRIDMEAATANQSQSTRVVVRRGFTTYDGDITIEIL